MLLTANSEDISSYSNFDKIKQEKIIINNFINFKEKILEGNVIIQFRRIDSNETKLILDCKGLVIKEITEKLSMRKLNWMLYKENKDREALGTPLVIELDEELLNVDKFEILIEYRTTEESVAIQWLEPHQTLTKKHPFMFTQCQAILARTMMPCQDTPAVKVIVEANITVEKPLIALFSGLEVQNENSTPTNSNLTTYKYIQSIPIPTYLIAIAAGELEYGRLSERCGVWTEVGLNQKAVWEFENTEEFLRTAETYLTPYVWTVYNILVLPFAFPYGGMENPNLTFVSPALIAGDRSLTHVVAHEIAHSWTGNLVTNKDWMSFWMNEGFTVFLERKICEILEGEEMAALQAKVGYEGLKEELSNLGEDNDYTALEPDFSGIDPDDAFSRVPYEKGFAFVHFLETLVGKNNFQKIFVTYINTFQNQSITQKDFRNLFETEVTSIYGESIAMEEILSKIDWQVWTKSPGYPPIKHEFESKWDEAALKLAESFIKLNNNEKSVEIFYNFPSSVKLVFLNYLKYRINLITDEVYANLRDNLNLHSEIHNANIKMIWYQIALSIKKDDVIEPVKRYLTTNGRINFVRAVYSAWFTFNREECVDFFTKNKMIYHGVVARLIEKKFSEMNSK